jgi:phosphoribosylformylglycinamidine synthase
MTECRYLEPLTSFKTGITPQPVKIIPLLEKGKEALEEINKGKFMLI